MAEPATAELTIDELARETGMTVRNIRAHQSRGLLPPPDVRARTGYYGQEHVARLQLIQELQGNGYNLAAIKHLLEGAEGSAQEVLGFAHALLAPFESEQAEVVDLTELGERYGPDADAALVERAVRLGILVPLGDDRFEVPSPTLLRAGEAVIGLGVPLDRALDVIEQVTRSAEAVGDVFVSLFLERVWQPFERGGQPDAEWPRVREALEQLRPLATEVLVAVFQQRMTGAVERAFGRELARRAKADRGSQQAAG